MAFSYSFHLSSKSNAVSTTGKAAQCGRHNLRLYQSDKYDRSQIEILKGSDHSIMDDIRKIYHDEFDEPLKTYNEHVRSDRRIDDYLKHVSDSRGDVAAEIIIQVGDKNFWADKTMDQKKQMSYIFKDQLRALEKLCPEFKIASAVVHYDEKSPHMHIVGVPVVDGYQKGLSKQVAKTKVFTKARLSYLQDVMRENMEKGLEMNPELFNGVDLKPKEKGRNKDIPKEAMDEYTHVKDETEKLRGEAADIDVQIHEKEKYLVKLSDNIEALETAKAEQERELDKTKQDLSSQELKLKNQINAYSLVSNKVRNNPAISMQFRNSKETVSDGLLKGTHEEYFVKIPVQSPEEGKEKIAEIKALYQKQYTQNAFKDVFDHFSKNYELKYKEREKALKSKQDEFEAYKQKEIDKLGIMRTKAIKECDAFKDLEVDLTPGQVKSMLNDTLTHNLALEISQQTCKQLDDQGYLKVSPTKAFLSINQNNILQSIKDHVHEFIDHVKERIISHTLKDKDMDLMMDNHFDDIDIDL